VRADPRITGNDQGDSAIEDGSQALPIHPVRFACPHWNVKADPLRPPGRLQPAQGGDKQGGRGLPVDVKIAPHADALPAGDGALNARAGLLDAGQLLGRAGMVQICVEERARGRQAV